MRNAAKTYSFQATEEQQKFFDAHSYINVSDFTRLALDTAIREYRKDPNRFLAKLGGLND